MEFGWTSTFSISWSPISALLMSSPLELQILMAHVGGGPVLEIVPAVVSVDTLNPICIPCSPVLYTQRILYAWDLKVTSFGCF